MHMEGAENVTIPHQAHVQVCTSWEAIPGDVHVPHRRAPDARHHPERGDDRDRRARVDLPDEHRARRARRSRSGRSPPTGGARRWYRRLRRPSPTAPRGAARGVRSPSPAGPLRVRADPRRPADLHTTASPSCAATTRCACCRRTRCSLSSAAGRGASTAVIRYKELWGDEPGGARFAEVNGLERLHRRSCARRAGNQRLLRLRRQPQRRVGHEPDPRARQRSRSSPRRTSTCLRRTRRARPSPGRCVREGRGRRAR